MGHAFVAASKSRVPKVTDARVTEKQLHAIRRRMRKALERSFCIASSRSSTLLLERGPDKVYQTLVGGRFRMVVLKYGQPARCEFTPVPHEPNEAETSIAR
jgi:hypothetical protein